MMYKKLNSNKLTSPSGRTLAAVIVASGLGIAVDSYYAGNGRDTPGAFPILPIVVGLASYAIDRKSTKSQ